jgi:hypothetical protein
MINLGDIARDSITGFEGVVVTRARLYRNCDRFTLQPQGLKDGDFKKAAIFDEVNVELVRPGVLKVLPLNRPPEKIELMDVVRDRITEFEGVVVGMVDHINGCSKVHIQSRSFKPDGTPIDPISVDEVDVILVERPKRKDPRPNTGGPRDDVRER